MRLAVLVSSAFALCLTPLSAQSVSADLREEIRRIVREEIRAALKEAQSTSGVEVFTRDENGLPGRAVRVAPVQKIEVAPVETIEVTPAEKIKVVTPAKVKALQGDDTVRVHVLDGAGKPVATKVFGTKKVTARTLDGDGDVHVLFDGGQTKAIVVTPDQLKKAVGECCEALEKCGEAIEECRAKAVETTPGLELQPVDPELIVIDDVTTGKQAEKAAQKAAEKAARKARKAEKKKAKQQQQNGGAV